MTKDFIYNLLANKLGATSVKGFNYLVEILYLKYQYHEAGVMFLRIGDLYRETAQHMNTTYSKVERAIRFYRDKVEYFHNLNDILSIAILDKYPAHEFVQNCYDYCVRESKAVAI